MTRQSIAREHPRDYRDITPEDIDAATRGLLMARRSRRDLTALAERHAKVNAFASAVICAAVEVELGLRDAVGSEV